VLRQQGDLEGAVRELTGAVEERPDDAQAFHLLGASLLKLSRTEAGLAALTRAIELDPNLVEARVTLAQGLARLGRTDEAQRQQQEIRRINAGNAAIGRSMLLLETAGDRLRAADRATALAQIREAIEASPTFAEAYYQLGLALLPGPADARESQQAFERVIQLDPQYAGAHYQLGLLFARRGATSEAEDHFRAALSLAPAMLEAHRAVLALAEQREDWQAVVEQATAVLALDPSDTDARARRMRAVSRITAGSEGRP
jgi:tetratricopeptide (TPR) repeat protein